jgi:hypothetical protein
MATWRWIAAAGLAAALCCVGCDFGSLMYFLSPEAKCEPELRRLAADGVGKEPRVVLLVTSRSLETRPELIQADRQLAELLAKQLRDQCAANQERLAIVAPRKVEEFKSSHPNWQALELREIGRSFNADYAVEVELDALSLYEKGTQDLFRGRAEVTLALVDVNHPDQGVDRRQWTCVYPSESGGGVAVGFDASAPQFRQSFLEYLAKRLAWNFTAHAQEEERQIN